MCSVTVGTRTSSRLATRTPNSIAKIQRAKPSDERRFTALMVLVLKWQQVDGVESFEHIAELLQTDLPPFLEETANNYFKVCQLNCLLYCTQALCQFYSVSCSFRTILRRAFRRFLRSGSTDTATTWWSLAKEYKKCWEKEVIQKQQRYLAFLHISRFLYISTHFVVISRFAFRTFILKVTVLK